MRRRVPGAGDSAETEGEVLGNKITEDQKKSLDLMTIMGIKE